MKTTKTAAPAQRCCQALLARTAVPRHRVAIRQMRSKLCRPLAESSATIIYYPRPSAETPGGLGSGGDEVGSRVVRRSLRPMGSSNRTHYSPVRRLSQTSAAAGTANKIPSPMTRGCSEITPTPIKPSPPTRATTPGRIEIGKLPRSTPDRGPRCILQCATGPNTKPRVRPTPKAQRPRSAIRHGREQYVPMLPGGPGHALTSIDPGEGY